MPTGAEEVEKALAYFVTCHRVLPGKRYLSFWHRARPRTRWGENPRWALMLVYNLVYYRTMIRLNIHEAKTHLSKYLAKLEKGETILLCRRNEPIAEIRPLAAKRKKPRPIGLDEGKIKLGPEFFEPLPDELLAYFNGEKP